jgi:hypothetical protein
MSEGEMNYSEVFSNAWKIIWKFKALWIFGILSSCMRSSGSSSGSGGSSGGGSSFLPGQGDLASPVLHFPGQIYQWAHLIQIKAEEDPWIIAAFIAAIFFLVAFIIMLSLFAGTLGRVGVARGSWLADEGETKLGFSKILNESLPFFWRVFLLFLLIFCLVLVFIIILVVPVIFLTILTFGLIWLILIPVILPLILLMILFSLGFRALLEESIVAIAGENLGAWQAITRSWNLLIEKPFPQLLVSFLTSLIEMVVSIIFVLPLIFIFLPFFISLIFETTTALGIGAAISGLSLLVYLPLMITAFGVLYAYMGSIWTLTFRRLTQRESKLV